MFFFPTLVTVCKILTESYCAGTNTRDDKLVLAWEGKKPNRNQQMPTTLALATCFNKLLRALTISPRATQPVCKSLSKSIASCLSCTSHKTKTSVGFVKF